MENGGAENLAAFVKPVSVRIEAGKNFVG